MSGCVRALVLGAVLIAGCTGFPQKPRPVQLPSAAPLSDLAGDAAGSWPAPQWWKRYQDPTLDQLIETGLASSPTLATAHARFESARQSVRLAGAARGVRVDAVGDVERQRLSDNGLFPPRLLGFYWYNQADLGLQASYTFDWWGKQRALIDAAMDEAHAAGADRSAAALLLASTIADTYYAWQAEQSRLALLREREATVQRAGAIVAARVGAQLDAGDTQNTTQSALAAAREEMAAVAGSATLRIVALAALVGREAAELPPLEAKTLPPVVARLPDGVRIDLIARRADITASRWRVEAAEKNLTAARADFYPDVSINVLAGVSSIEIGRLLEYGSRVPLAMAAIHLPLFDAGRLKARYGADQAAVDAAVAGYRETLIEAARDVATQVSTRAEIAAQRAQRQIEVDAAGRLRMSALARAKQGLTDARPQLAASESWLEQRDALLQLDAAALSADIALQRALGGGYESKAP